MDDPSFSIYCGCICQCLFLVASIKNSRKIIGWSRIDKILFVTLYVTLTFIQYILSVSSLHRNAMSVVVVKPDILSINECDVIISSAEKTADKLGGWQTARHKSYPTTDMSAYTINEKVYINNSTYEFGLWLNSTVNNRIFPHIASHFALDQRHLYMKDLFVVKYDINGQVSLPEHRDSSQLTFGIALNQVGADFEGGGTRIILADDVINIARGHMQMHDSGLYHAGYPITAGSRYIMVGFVNVRINMNTWWRSYGAMASCVMVQVDEPLVFPPSSNSTVWPHISIAQLSPHDDIQHKPRCRSWLWRISYFINRAVKDVASTVFVNHNDNLRDKPVGNKSSGTTSSMSSIVVLLVLGVLTILLVVVLAAMISLCVCGDAFNAYYCHYVILLLTPLEQLVDPELAAYHRDARRQRQQSCDLDVENCPSTVYCGGGGRYSNDYISNKDL